MAGPFGFTSYSIENDLKMARAIDRAIKQVGDLTVPFAQIAKDFQKSRKAIFLLQKAPEGWDDLHPAYKERKQREVGFIYPILRLTRRLEKSITDPNHPENVTRIDPKSLSMGTTVPYADAHQQEGPKKTGKMPLRKFLFIGPESVKFANNELAGFPKRALNTINSYVLRELGLSIEEATGVKPKIKKGKA